jgi:hypothetical protein
MPPRGKWDPQKDLAAEQGCAAHSTDTREKL